LAIFKVIAPNTCPGSAAAQKEAPAPLLRRGFFVGPFKFMLRMKREGPYLPGGNQVKARPELCRRPEDLDDSITVP
jgi:hypothetical protein